MNNSSNPSSHAASGSVSGSPLAASPLLFTSTSSRPQRSPASIDQPGDVPRLRQVAANGESIDLLGQVLHLLTTRHESNPVPVGSELPRTGRADAAAGRGHDRYPLRCRHLLAHCSAGISTSWMRLPQGHSSIAILTSSARRGGLHELYSKVAEAAEFGVDNIHLKRGEGDAVGHERGLERRHGDVVAGLQQQLGAVGGRRSPSA